MYGNVNSTLCVAFSPVRRARGLSYWSKESGHPFTGRPLCLNVRRPKGAPAEWLLQYQHLQHLSEAVGAQFVEVDA